MRLTVARPLAPPSRYNRVTTSTSSSRSTRRMRSSFPAGGFGAAGVIDVDVLLGDSGP